MSNSTVLSLQANLYFFLEDAYENDRNWKKKPYEMSELVEKDGSYNKWLVAQAISFVTTYIEADDFPECFYDLEHWLHVSDAVNRILQKLGYLDDDLEITDKCHNLFFK